MSEEQKATIIVLVILIGLSVFLIVFTAVNGRKRKEERKEATSSDKEDSLFPFRFDDPKREPSIHGLNDISDFTLLYEYGGKNVSMKKCQYCGVENDVDSDRCSVCGNETA